MSSIISLGSGCPIRNIVLDVDYQLFNITENDESENPQKELSLFRNGLLILEDCEKGVITLRSHQGQADEYSSPSVVEYAFEVYKGEITNAGGCET